MEPDTLGLGPRPGPSPIAVLAADAGRWSRGPQSGVAGLPMIRVSDSLAELRDASVLVVDLLDVADPVAALPVAEARAGASVIAVLAADAGDGPAVAAALRADGVAVVVSTVEAALWCAAALSAAARLHDRAVQSLTLARVRLSFVARGDGVDPALVDAADDAVAEAAAELVAVVGDIGAMGRLT